MSNEFPNKLGFAGFLAKMFVHSKLTPVVIFVSLLLGLFSIYLTPKEEEPQISVPMIDIQVASPGFDAREVERKVTEPIERALWGQDGVEYVYSASQAHGALITVRFKVGEPIGPSLVKIHHKLMSIRQDLPSNVQSIDVKEFSIDDVPFLTLTFSSKNRSDYELRTLVAPLARELSSTPHLSRVELLGGQKRAIRVIVDPKKLAEKGVSIMAVAAALKANNAYFPVGKNWSDKNVFDVDVGGRISSSSEIEKISVGQRGGRLIHVSDVAKIVDGPEEYTHSSVLFDKSKSSEPETAVSIVFAKRKGTNVVSLANSVVERTKRFAKQLPPDVSFVEVRNYGKTASQKSNELIEHLLLATLSVSALIALVMGYRAAIVVAIAIPVTLALTLAVYYFLGYTLNRVTLFALIFSIGILVDDAIVVVENIERHLKMDHRLGIVKATIRAVSEVGNPTILATFAVIAAILPMAFVQGLMGPYMKPIPVGASMAMILSLLVAFIVTPWAAVRILSKKHATKEENPAHLGKMDRWYRKFMTKMLVEKKASVVFFSVTVLLLILSASMIYFKSVKVKMLPFDNKNEFQVLVDYQPSTPLSENIEMSKELARELLKNKEIEKVQIFSGEPAPYSFSGMVKHTFLRKSDYQSDLQIVLKPKEDRRVSSHKVIESLRPEVKKFADKHHAILKILEIPPGPPVLSTMLAEVYGPDAETREKVAKEIYDIFASEPSVVDLDNTWRPGRSRLAYKYDQGLGGLLGVNASQVVGIGRYLFSETPLFTINDSSSPEDVNVDLSIAQSVRSGDNPFVDENLSSFESGVVRSAQLLQKPQVLEQETFYRKNLKPVSYVMSELSGEEEAPVYGMLKLLPKIKYKTQTADVPWDTLQPIIKWDGEWFITYEVFRDLGTAFAVVLILIYFLVVGWFKSFSVPLVIMAPIPISLIGILPGHWMMGAYFTATSMIGFIAGAGIIVRNSIILVDFIEHQLVSGMGLRDAVISAGVLRFRPMLLTAAAVVVGSSVILFDPIFQGLAVSLIFGEFAATVLSRFAVPLLYYWFVGRSRVKHLISAQHSDAHGEVVYEHSI